VFQPYRNSSRAANSAVSSAAAAVAAVLFGLLCGACTNYEHRSALSPVVVVTAFFRRVIVFRDSRTRFVSIHSWTLTMPVAAIVQ